ncbi:MAG: BatD family protein [Labilithrix sp.]|nr:BatD family protein [Labilithrix sp.]
MRRAILRVLALCAFAIAFLAAKPARAQEVEIRAGVDTDTVEVGDSVTYTLYAMVKGGGAGPTDPKLGSAAGFTVHATSSAPVHMRMNINGVQSDLNGLTTTWMLRAERPGTFTVGPSQITALGAKRNAKAVRITVVPRGKGQPRMRAPSPFDPFGSGTLDPFKGLFDFGDDVRVPPPEQPTADPKLAMNEPRAPIAFLHATIDKTRAVVGEQVTLSVYLYEDPYSRQGRAGDVHEASAADFVKRSLLEDETRTIGVGTALVGGKLWNVKLVRKNALFPLKTGHLAIDPMSMTLPQARVGLRESERLFVDVSDPPVNGRPAGYALGDVGDMALQATVTPRSVARDGAVGVTLELRGTGNLPGALTLPVVPGVEWLEPQIRDRLGAQGERFGGTRTFSYVVRLHKPGEIDLGEVRLPYFDADKRAYGIARATLGIVTVADGVAKDAGVEEAEPVLAAMPKERRVLEGSTPHAYLSERPHFWMALFGSPLACAFVVSAHGLFRRARERRAAQSPSPGRIARERRAEADAACRGDDGAVAMGAVARAIEADVVARAGVNLRGATGETAIAELTDEGVAADDARAIVDVLRACEDARFSPDGVDVAAARDAWSRARAILERVRGASGGKGE